MGGLWQELVDALGFVVSAILVLIIMPMCVVALFGMMSSPESAFGFIFAILIVGGGIYAIANVVTEQDKKKSEESQYVPIMDTTVEKEEAENIRKRQHFEKLFFTENVRKKYHMGSIDYQMYEYVCVFHRELVKAPGLEFLSSRIYNLSVSVKDVSDPSRALSKVINHCISYHDYRSRKHMEENYPELLEQLRWGVTYACLCEVYSKHEFFTVMLSSDCQEYKLGFTMPYVPCKYNFLCDEETEAEFYIEARKKVTKFKEYARSLTWHDDRGRDEVKRLLKFDREKCKDFYYYHEDEEERPKPVEPCPEKPKERVIVYERTT